MKAKEVTKPNIFHFAPSELTQDAFICWLASWAHKDLEEINKQLHYAGVMFIKKMLEKHQITLEEDKIYPNIKKQHQNIDVVIELDEYVLLIEDKVFTRQHSNQLHRYRKILEEEYQEKKVLPIYVQTGNQSGYAQIKAEGYKPFLRQDFLGVLEKGVSSGIDNNIYKSFYDHLKQIDVRFKSFQNKTLDNWDWDGWKGFYSVLEDEFNEGSWDYVANPSGGFMGFWWHFIDVDECTVYLQLENEKLCFKISVKEEGSYSKLRNYWHKKIIEAGKNSELNISKPTRFGHGKQMTVAVLEDDYRVTDDRKILDLDKTIQKLRQATVILYKFSVDA